MVSHRMNIQEVLVHFEMNVFVNVHSDYKVKRVKVQDLNNFTNILTLVHSKH